MTKKSKTGVAEWAQHSVNCCIGCEHACRYCYARAHALRFKLIENPNEWETPRIMKTFKNKRLMVEGVVMFPSQHDITPVNFDACRIVLENLLQAGNQVLLVSKPHFECIERICSLFRDYRDQLHFRFSIGSMISSHLLYWEPGAPNFTEREGCLAIAMDRGFQTSVSCEPCLDSTTVFSLFHRLKSKITESFWIGMMNKMALRCKDCDPAEVARIQAGQTDEAVMRVYDALKDEPLVKWKDSYREVIDRHFPKVTIMNPCKPWTPDKNE